MKTLLFLTVMIAAVGFVGCNSLDNSPMGQTPSRNAPAVRSSQRVDLANVEVSLKSLDYSDQSLNYSLRVESGDRAGEEFTYVERKNAGPNSYSYSLLDTTGALLWEYEVAWDGQTMSVVERTAEDELAMSYGVQGAVRTETYSLDSAPVLELACDTSLHRKLLAESAGNPVEYSASEEALLQQLRSQLGAYLQDVGTLSDNPYGYLVSDILENHDVVEVLPELRVMQKRSRDAQFVCDFAETCALFKCLFGLVGNPVCAACTGLVLGCWIEKYFFL